MSRLPPERHYYRALPWRDDPLFEPCEYEGRFQVVYEPPPPIPIGNLAAAALSTISLSTRAHILAPSRCRWGWNEAFIYREEGDERVDRALALFGLASRLLEWIYMNVVAAGQWRG